MAAYAALFPLKSRLRSFLKHYDACFDPSTLELTQNLYKEVISFQQFLGRLDTSSRKRMNASLTRITEAISEFRDLFLLHLNDQYDVAQEHRNRLSLRAQETDDDNVGSVKYYLIDLRHLRRDVHSFIEKLNKMKEEYEEDDESSFLDFDGNKDKMVGFSDLYTLLKENIVRGDSGGSLKRLSIVGMAGIGKTTLAKKIYDDFDLVEWFDFRAWVTVGRDWQLHKTIRGILAQVNPMLSMGEDDEDERERECEHLKESLKGKRYLIVLDDVWEVQVWDDLNKILKTMMKNVAGSRVLITTRMLDVVDRAGLESGIGSLDMRLLNKEESWDLLRQKVFSAEPCSFQLERAGRRIAEKCDGLPLTIVMVADLLSKEEKTVEYWNEVSTQGKHQVFVAAYDEVTNVLYPSYEYLPQHLKIYFLYMGVFPQNYEIPTSKIINMWLAEGLILERNTMKSFRKHGKKCLNKLASSNVMVYRKSTRSSPSMSIANMGIKVCSLHSSWWHLCYKEAMKNKFFRVLNNREDCLSDNIEGQIRLCIHNNILLGMKEVYDTMENCCGSSACSLLLYGPYNRYPVPICSALKLLKVLDALKIRFYDFPSQVLELVKLKYLALTCDGELPRSISKLEKLEFLIIAPHQNIRSSGAFLYLPLDIWDLEELKHLQVTGSDLPDFSTTSLPNLSTLLDVSARSCTKGVFERVENLKTLGIRIELPPDHCGEPLSCFDHVSVLKNLKSLKCVVVNPEFRSELVPPPTLSNLPLYLKKLALSGIGYPWSEMSKIASLRKLKVLKLRCNAFQGVKWEVEENAFAALEYLLLEDCDLEHWIVGCRSFRGLEHLSIKHCYNLREIDWECEDNISMIEVDDCDPVVEKLIKEAKWGKGMLALDISVHSSWNDGKLKS